MKRLIRTVIAFTMLALLMLAVASVAQAQTVQQTRDQDQIQQQLQDYVRDMTQDRDRTQLRTHVPGTVSDATLDQIRTRARDRAYQLLDITGMTIQGDRAAATVRLRDRDGAVVIWNAELLRATDRSGNPWTIINPDFTAGPAGAGPGLPWYYGAAAYLGNPNFGQQVREWQTLRVRLGQNPYDWEALRQHLVAIGAPNPGPNPPPGWIPNSAAGAGPGLPWYSGVNTQLGNPNFGQQVREWQILRAQRGQNPFDWQALRQHLIAIGAPDPGPNPPMGW